MGDSEKLDRILFILETELRQEKQTNNVMLNEISTLQRENDTLLNIINNKFNQ